MQSRIVSSVVVALALLLSASFSVAAESKAGTPAEAKPAATAKTPEKSAKAKPAKRTAKVKLVDINSASKADLMKLPGIGAAEADKIIAGRPYLTKAHLVTHQALPAWIYEGIKGQIVAKPNKATEAKLKEMEKQR